MSNDFYNTEGYKDSTAYKAIMAIEEAKKRKMKEQAEHDKLKKGEVRNEKNSCIHKRQNNRGLFCR